MPCGDGQKKKCNGLSGNGLMAGIFLAGKYDFRKMRRHLVVYLCVDEDLGL